MNAISDRLPLEAYRLNPYSPAVLKNRFQWTFGTVFPSQWATGRNSHECNGIGTDFLVEGASPTLNLDLRLLRPASRLSARGGEHGDPGGGGGGVERELRQEGIEHRVSEAGISVADLSGVAGRTGSAWERLTLPFEIPEGKWTDQGGSRFALPLQGVIELSSREVAPELWQVSLRVENRTCCDPGLARERAILAAFEVAHARIDATCGEFVSLQDPPHPVRTSFRPGDRVRVRPLEHADAVDLALAGRAATVAGTSFDYGGRQHVAVTIDGAPGRDLGAAGHVGHRFFFRPEELERADPAR